MILDTNLMLANATAVPVALATGTLANVVDLGAAVKNIFAGEPLYAVINISTAFTSAGAATVDFRFVTDAQDPMAVDGTATFHGSTGPLPLSALVVGARFVVSLNKLGPNAERYLGVNITNGVAALTAGAVGIHIVSNESAPDSWRAYSDAVN